MFEIFLDFNTWATLFLLVGLELVLGIDNILIISILVGKIPAERREFARKLGLSIALAARFLVLLAVSSLQKLSTPLYLQFTGKDFVVLAGGLFLIYKAVTEIHHLMDRDDEDDRKVSAVDATLSAVVVQILLFDLIFSLDSIITAVGLTEHLIVIYLAVLLSFFGVLLFSKPIAAFINAHAALKILALSFLVVIGVTLFLEGMHVHVPKAYIYMPMGFALVVELLQMRQAAGRKKA